MKRKHAKPAADQAQSPARGKQRTPAQPGKHDRAPDADAGALAWRAADYEKLVGFGDFAFTFSLGAGFLAAPLAAIFVLANIGNVFVSLFKGDALHWLIPDNDTLVLLAVLSAAMGAAFSWTSISSREIIAYEIDLEAQIITLHLAYFPKRLDLVALPLSGIVSLTPSMPDCLADAGYFAIVYSMNGLAPQHWETRIGIVKGTLFAHADALRPTLGERVHLLVVDDR